MDAISFCFFYGLLDSLESTGEWELGTVIGESWELGFGRVVHCFFFFFNMN